MQSPSESLLNPFLLDKVQNLRQMSSAVLMVVDAEIVVLGLVGTMILWMLLLLLLTLTAVSLLWFVCMLGGLS